MGVFGTIARDIVSNVASDKISSHLPFKKGGSVKARAKIPSKKRVRYHVYKKGGRVKRKGSRVKR